MSTAVGLRLPHCVIITVEDFNPHPLKPDLFYVVATVVDVLLGLQSNESWAAAFVNMPQLLIAPPLSVFHGLYDHDVHSAISASLAPKPIQRGRLHNLIRLPPSLHHLPRYRISRLFDALRNQNAKTTTTVTIYGDMAWLNVFVVVIGPHEFTSSDAHWGLNQQFWTFRSDSNPEPHTTLAFRNDVSYIDLRLPCFAFPG
ncbi:hypothetical protein DFH08DRAFT_822301 [Mycena albidolilacea]|uniref:Uncharacterized protein n=1 Tax=Mycena albidolilacea TaxID=1033008 RepID=A0AAD6Z8X8_9AGAR|nr:hypothetical protein DFH08DRAFT_822301 [Mycena albidolilacea]